MNETAKALNMDPLAYEVHRQYEAAYIHKDSLGLHEDWATFEAYYRGTQNPPEGPNDPASNTNIILSKVEAMVADLVDMPVEVSVKGWTLTDRAAAPLAQRVAEWIWEKNRMTPKRERVTRDRLKFGTGIYKVFFDGTVGEVGFPRIEPVNPKNFFPDPKIRSHTQLHMADYVIHAVPRPLGYLRRRYPKAAQLRPEPHPNYDPELFDDEGTSFAEYAENEVLVLERWTIENDGHLRKVVVAQGVVLYDSDDDEVAGELYRRLNRYPFVMVPCWPVEGRPWGMGMVQVLKPVQDLINDLDDQIRMNARLTGNIQKVISVRSGIDPRKWDATPGLNIPAFDINGFRIVEPPNMPPYIINRMNEAKLQDADLVSGRHEVAEGRRPGSVRAASAIIALQEAALKTANHLRLMEEEALREVFQIVLDYVMEFWTEEVEIGEEILYGENGEEKGRKPILVRGTDFANLPILNDDGQPVIDPETGQPITRRANFDITVSVGAGMPTNKAFIYQAVLELVQYGLLTQEEGRAVIKEVMNFPIIDPWQPQGNFIGRAGQSQQPPPDQLPAEVQMGNQGTPPIPPEMMLQVADLLGGGPRA